METVAANERARIGATLRALRRAKDVGSRRLAVAVGTTHGHIANVEAGRRGASPELLARIADALDVPLAALVVVADRDVA